MKIAHLTIAESWPGGVIAVSRLHKGLITHNIDSVLLSGNMVFDGYKVRPAPPPALSIKKRLLSTIRYHRDSFPFGLTQHAITEDFFTNLRPNYISRYVNNGFDLVHLHFPVPEYIPIYELSKIRKPIVWTLHDSWPFTGGCIFPGNCTRFTDSCGKCPVLKSRSDNDLSRKVLLAKKRYWANLDLTIITPSKWMADRALRSSLFANSKLRVIPHGLDLSVFRPHNKKHIKELLGLPANKNIILFGAHNCSLPHKGYKYLSEAIELAKLSPKNNCVVTFGSSYKLRDKRLSNYQQQHMEIIKDERMMAYLYSAADIFIAPYLFDSFGQTLTESLACGTPVVAFGVGGPLDIIDHKENGYLAKPYDSMDLAQGIQWALNHPDKKELSRKARQKAVGYFDIKKVAQQHIKLYQTILDSR